MNAVRSLRTRQLASASYWRSAGTGCDSGGTGSEAAVWVVVATEIADGVYASSSSDPASYLKLTVSVGLDLSELIRQAACVAANSSMAGPV